MSKASRKAKANRTQSTLPAAESLQSKPATSTHAQAQGTPPASAAERSLPAPVQAGKPEATTSVAKKPASAVPTGRTNKVSMEFFNSEAKKVCVAGSFNDWAPDASPLSSAGNGRWVCDLAVGPGRYEYCFVVDGAWQADPNAKETVANPYGGHNSVLVVSN